MWGNRCGHRRSIHQRYHLGLLLLVTTTATATTTPIIMRRRTGVRRQQSLEIPREDMVGVCLTEQSQTTPLLAVPAAGFFNCPVNLSVGFADVLVDDARFCFNLFHGGLLLNNCSLHILEELSKLNHLPLDFLDGFVPALYCAQCRLRLTSAITLQKLRNMISIHLLRKNR